MAVLRAFVYESNGETLITEIPHRFGLAGQESLNVAGTGSLSIKLPNDLGNAYPGMYGWGNIIKFYLGSKCISGFRIQGRTTTWVSSDEYVGYVRTLSGPTLMILLDDFIVKHDGKPRPDSLDQRSYSWASLRDEWYNASQWNAPIATRPWTDPPGKTIVYWTAPPPPKDPKPSGTGSGTTIGTTAPEATTTSTTTKKPKPGPDVPGSIRHTTKAKSNQPKGWRDKTANWMFIPPGYSGKRGGKFYRKNFFLKNHRHVRIFGAADERLRIYMDGEEVLSADNVETGYTQKNVVDLMLARGHHTIAVFANGIYSAKGDGNDSVLISMMGVNTRGRASDVILHSDASWEAHYGSPPPGWNRAQVMRNMVHEAKARGNSSAQMLSLGFGEHLDSENHKWHDRWHDDVPIGTTGLGLVALLSEGGHFDVWVDPGSLTIRAARRRGRNKAHSITLEPGRNLLSWEVDETDDVKNDYLLQFEGGWTSWKAHKSKKTYGDREVFVSLGDSKHPSEARNLIRRASRGIASAVQRAGTSDLRTVKQDQPTGGLIAVAGARPFLDFGVGDVIKAPNWEGIMVPHRVLSLSFTEDEQGNVTYDPELEEVR